MIQVIVPTYNRASCMQNLIMQSIMPYKGKIFSFLILDSSIDDNTEKLCAQVVHNNNFVYKRIKDSVQPDDKVIDAIKRCKDDYYWLFGDGNLANFNELETLLLDMNYSRYTVLEIDVINSKRNPIYNTACTMVQKNLMEYIPLHFTYLTYWGSSIIRTKQAKELFQCGRMDKYRQDVLSWWSPCLICEIISTDMDIGVQTDICSIYTSFFGLNDAKKERSWAHGEQYYITTFEVFNRDVKLLPSKFDSIKYDIIKSFRDDLLVSKRYLLHLKYSGVLQVRYVKKYKKDIKVVNSDYWFMLFLSVMPCAVLKEFNKIIKSGKRMIK